jgi:hypothetical protein
LKAGKVRDAEDERVDFMNPSPRMIIELNIKHYRTLLKSETDALKRKTIAALLTEEEAKFYNLLVNDDHSDGRHA